ncbi:MAG: PAS domain S-box protein [Candidatus Thorarchaeota archaeon]
MDIILVVIAEVDLGDTFTYISPGVYDIFGYQHEEVIGSQLFSYIHPNNTDTIIESFKKALDGGEAIV